MLEWNEEKRQLTLEKRGLDFSDAALVFAGDNLINTEDVRQDYGETRIITVGYLNERMVVIVWTQRGENRRIISMRKANEREYAEYIVNFQR